MSQPIQPNPDAQRQAELFSIFGQGAELLTVEEDAKVGRYSGAIVDRNRERLEAICNALAQGIGIKRVAQAFGASIHTVMAIRERHPDLIATEKKALSGQIGRILKLSADRYEEALVEGAIAPGQIPVGFGIFADKKSLLDGDPTAIVEQRSSGPRTEDVRAYLERMTRVNGLVEDQKETSSDSQSDANS